ncbi:hypothetical protein [Carnobacterium sp. FSL W8-0810]|uniref:hypothetical protein n=1 Tax=Carnobacterium sp. FSL W8-0810 TaxID=2954705 RepID=UPI0030F9D5D9
MVNKEIKIWGSNQIYFPFSLSYKKNHSYAKKIKNFHDQNLIVGVYDSENKQFLLKNKITEYFESNANTRNTKFYDDISKASHPEVSIRPVNFKPDQNLLDSVDKDDLIFVFENQGEKLLVGAHSKFIDNLYYYEDYYNNKLEHDAKTYGRTATYEKIYRFILFPIRVLFNEEHVYINIMLEIFSNGMGFLKVDLPIEDVKISDFFDNSSYSKFESVYLPKFLIGKYEKSFEYEKVEENDIYTIINTYYTRYIFEYFKLNVFVDRPIVNTLITDTNIPIKNLSNMGMEMEEALYRLLRRPVDPKMSVKGKLNKIKNDFWGTNEVRTYVSENGNSLSIAGSNFKKIFITEEYEEEEARDSVKISLEHTIDFPLKILILKRLNNISLYKEMNLNIRKMTYLKEHNLLNNIFIIELTEEFYGSALELIDYMEKGMKWYLNKETIVDKNYNLQELILSKRESQKKRQSEYLSIIGFVFTVIFALPTLTETTEIAVRIIDPKISETIISQLSHRWGFWIWIIVLVVQLFIGIYFSTENIIYTIRSFSMKIRNILKSIVEKARNIISQSNLWIKKVLSLSKCLKRRETLQDTDTK